MAEEELHSDEVYALAEAFQVVEARVLLIRAKFPAWAVPETGYANSLEFWSQIARQVANGVMPDGRRAVIAAAHRQFPFNAAFREVTPEAGSAARSAEVPGPATSVSHARGVQVGENNVQVNFFLAGDTESPPAPES